MTLHKYNTCMATANSCYCSCHSNPGGQPINMSNDIINHYNSYNYSNILLNLDMVLVDQQQVVQ